MPFTFSHPALVLPLTWLPRRWFSLTGLIIGSLVPDFEYFLRMKIQSEYSHTLSGLLWFDLPFGLLLTFIFHIIVRNSLYDNVPFVLKSRLAAYTRFDWIAHFKRHWFVVSFSILFAAALHLFWDSFTHDNGYFVQTISALTTKVTLFGRQLSVSKIIQHSSTLIGIIVVLYAIYKLPVTKNVSRKINIYYWAILIVFTIAIIAIRLFCGLNYRLYGHLIATGISAGLIALIITSLLIKNTNKQAP